VLPPRSQQQQHQQHQQQHWRQPSSTGSAGSASGFRASIGDVAALFGAEGPPEDPVEPFTMYGTTSKKYVIEQLDGTKVLARKRGFTVTTCVSAIPQSLETPEFQGLGTGEKVGGRMASCPGPSAAADGGGRARDPSAAWRPEASSSGHSCCSA
jgi:hypothetical protein